MPLAIFHRTTPQRDENVSRSRAILPRNAPTWRGYYSDDPCFSGITALAGWRGIIAI